MEDVAALKELLDQRFKAHCREHELMEIARTETRDDMERRLDGMNHFVEKMDAIEAKYVTRAEWQIQHESLTLVVSNNGILIRKLEATALGGDYTKGVDEKFKGVDDKFTVYVKWMENKAADFEKEIGKVKLTIAMATGGLAVVVFILKFYHP
jgi:hypothetical protein